MLRGKSGTSERTGEDGRQNIMKELRELLGEEWVCDSPSVLSNYGGTCHSPDGKNPEIVVFPSSSNEVQEVVNIVRKYAVPLLSMSAFFDHTEGRISSHGGVLMDLRRMDIVGG